MRWAAAGDQGKDETRRELAATAEQQQELAATAEQQQDLPLEVFVRPGHTPERVGLPWPDDDDGDDGDDDGDECDDKDDHTYFDDDDGGTGSTAEQRKQAWSYPQREQAPVAAAEPKAGGVGGQRRQPIDRKLAYSGTSSTRQQRKEKAPIERKRAWAHAGKSTSQRGQAPIAVAEPKARVVAPRQQGRKKAASTSTGISSIYIYR